jgi:hypothetical protein
MAIDDQALKDALRAIEAGETPEDLDLPDPEEYDDMGGIKSLDRGAPSIKLASEPSEDEIQLELGTVYEEFLDAVKEGFQGSFDDYARQYFTRKKAMQDRQMAMNGGRMQYGDGTDKKEYNFMDLIDPKAEDEYYKIKEEQLDRKYNPKNYPPSQRNMSMEELKKMLKKAEEDKVKKAKGGIAGVL